MSVKVIESTMVYPAEETPRRILWLSRLDMIIRMPYSHSNAMLIFGPAEDKENGPKFFDADFIKKTLSTVLVPFYPMAGRLKKNESNGRYEIDCNAAGVSFVVVETSHTLADLGDEYRKIAIPTCDYSGGLSSFPLLLIQVTHFKCGHVCVGVAVHHHLTDGGGIAYFLISWTMIARGLELPFQPFFDRTVYLTPRNPPQVEFQHLEYEPPLPPLPPKGLRGEMATARECMFKFSERQINTIKLQVTSVPQEEQGYKPSTYEVLAGHVWRSACKARGLTGDQLVKLYIHTDGRKRMRDPSLPSGYVGNVIFFTACIADAHDIICKPLWYATTKVHEALVRVQNPEYLRSAIDYLESQPDLESLVRGPQHVTCPNLFINSWVKFPTNQGDSGWGLPKALEQGGIRNEGQAFLLASPEDGSISLTIKLFTDHIPLFEKCLYDFEIISSL